MRLAVVVRAARVVEYASRSDAHARLVRVETLGREEAHVVAGHHRDAELARGVQGEVVERLLAVEAAAGQLQVQALAELAPQVGQGLPGEALEIGRASCRDRGWQNG